VIDKKRDDSRHCELDETWKWPRLRGGLEADWTGVFAGAEFWVHWSECASSHGEGLPMQNGSLRLKGGSADKAPFTNGHQMMIRSEGEWI
jgi:hypothetical protein